ncbi:hypothetical protein K1T71_010719 [Dendrolimus kikuchii]|uniref:Uncharacterized protein n=1 Tax=Dendrolimus kikuchii TaxID=765133 RepID=A0ACC1CPN2_9NEOP|nr:hypothetical protein K1T71_010719 [Dendrolimus kikuchii]
MDKQILFKLWVIKFCLKVVYPKFNCYCFLVFIAIKYRLWHLKSISRKGMCTYKLKTIPCCLANYLVKNHIENKSQVLLNKCIIISKEQYIQLGSENLFYLENGVLWLVLKLSKECKKKFKDKVKKDNGELKYNFHFMTSELHKKLWPNEGINDIDSIRIVPVIGSKLVNDDTAYVTENEIYNIASSFGIEGCRNIEITFHSIPSFEYSAKIAAIAEVSLILNDYDLSNDFVKDLLNNYFDLPKLISINDVFTINLTPEMTRKYHYKYLDLVESTGKLYFKCIKLSSDTGNESNISTQCDNIIQSYFIVKGVTQLTLGENVHSLKPRDEYYKFQGSEDPLKLNKLCPTGLRQKFEQIQETISPFLNGDINDLSLSMPSPILPILLLTGPLGSGKHLLVRILAKYNGMNYLHIDCNALQSSTAKQTESKITSTVQKAKAAAPVIVLLDNFEVFAVDSENNEDCRVMEYFMSTILDLYQNYTKHPIIFIAITERQDLKPNMLRIFIDKFHIGRPNLKQRYEMLEWFVSVMQLNIDGIEQTTPNEICDSLVLNERVKNVLHKVAAKTETFLNGDLDVLLHFAMRESYLKQHNSYNQLPPDPDLQLVREEDFDSALEFIRALQSQHLDAPKIPKVYWDDIGGLENLKRELLKTIEFPIKYPHLFKNSSLKRSGILLYGPPGCGKTLVAKAVSTELNVSFLSVKGPELLNMYIGQSEENVRKVFESARASSPCIVFLDELDALAPRRGAAGDSGGAADRVVSQLLAEIDGVASTDADTTSFVFIMGATNRPDLLEQSLLRPGRLDKLIYVGPYCGRHQKTSVLKALCNNYTLRPEVNLDAVSEALPEKCTGADLLQVVSTARAAAVRKLVANLNAGLVKESELSPDSVILGVSEMWQGVEAFRPSVTDEELAYYESVQSQM